MKAKIVIASTLKSIYDVRSYHKIALSVAKLNKYEINIIGNHEKSVKKNSTIKFHSHKLTRNNWLKRYFIRWKILFKILKIQPKFLIITTHELIGITFFIKLFSRSKIIYDIQENYYNNTILLSTFSFRKIIGNLIRLKEKIYTPLINQFLLAEKCYENELPFIGNKYMILENKTYEVHQERKENNSLKFLFSGTISEYSGIIKNIIIFRKLKKEIPDISLTIIGQIHSDKLLNTLEKIASNSNENIELIVSKNAIPHSEIVGQIFEANIGIISYQENKVNKNKIPTKLYEYSRYQLPYLVQENTTWSTKGNELGGAIPVNFDNFNTKKFKEQYKKAKESFSKNYPKSATWEEESNKLINYLKE